MHFKSLAILAAAALAASAVPAHAVWKSYISHPLGFSYEAPGEVKAERGTYSSPVAGTRDTIVFSSSEDGIEYKVTVVDMAEIQNKSATLLNEATYDYQVGKRLLMDTFGRVDRQYGRKLSIDLDGGGRATASFYFLDGHLIIMEATARPPEGDIGSPDLSRFTDSIAFFTVRARPDATELTLPK